MFLYANGDSFVAGDELNFYKLSGYPGDLKEWPENRDLYKKWLNTHFDNDPNLEDNIVATQHIESFPQKIATYINCDVKNNAKGGSSMTRIVRTTLQDLLFYKKKHQNIIALIGIPTLGGREEISGANNEWHQIQIFNKSNDRINEYIKYKLEYETDYHKINQQLRELIQLQNFCKVLDIKLLFVEFDSFFIKVKKYCEFNDINLFLQHLNTPYYSMTEAKNKAKKPYSILGHYSREVHTLAANDIIKQMVKFKWIL